MMTAEVMEQDVDKGYAWVILAGIVTYNTMELRSDLVHFNGPSDGTDSSNPYRLKLISYTERNI